MCAGVTRDPGGTHQGLSIPRDDLTLCHVGRGAAVCGAVVMVIPGWWQRTWQCPGKAGIMLENGSEKVVSYNRYLI